MANKPKKGEYLEIILRSPQTVFSIKDVALLWGEERAEVIRKRLGKYIQAGKLLRVRRGFYTKNKQYDCLELATRINTPSYISFETVLTRAWVSFQHYGNIFVASYVNRELVVDGQNITYVRMKPYVLSNTTGITHVGGVAMASPERAFLDRLYVSKEYHFDNLRSLDWDRVMEIVPIYRNQRLERTVEAYKNAMI